MQQSLSYIKRTYCVTISKRYICSSLFHILREPIGSSVAEQDDRFNKVLRVVASYVAQVCSELPSLLTCQGHPTFQACIYIYERVLHGLVILSRPNRPHGIMHVNVDISQLTNWPRQGGARTELVPYM
jgi:hypothetical protein